MFEGRDPWELSAKIRGDARLFSFVLKEADACAVSELALPAKTPVVCFYRGERFGLPEDDTTLHAGDEVAVVTEGRKHEKLAARCGQPAAAPRR